MALGEPCKTRMKNMKTLDEKAAEYAKGVITAFPELEKYKGIIETVYGRGASENEELSEGEPGDFGKALRSLKRGKCVARQEWGSRCFVVKQINSQIEAAIVPKMQSLPDHAKEVLSKRGDGSIHYCEQCLLVYPDDTKASIATNYIPDWLDMCAEYWVLIN